MHSRIPLRCRPKISRDGIPITEQSPDGISQLSVRPGYWGPDPKLEAAYKDKLKRMEQNPQEKLSPGEFLRFLLLDRDGPHGVAEEEEILKKFEAKIEKNQGYLREEVFNRHYHFIFPQLQSQLFILSNRGIGFWRKTDYKFADANGIVLDMTRDLHHVNKFFQELYQDGPTLQRQKANRLH